MVQLSKATTCALITYITRNGLNYPKIETVR